MTKSGWFAVAITLLAVFVLVVSRLEFFPTPPATVSIVSPNTAFGELAVAEPRPIIQLQFPYSINPRLVTSAASGSGTATITSSLLTVATGTTPASDLMFRSVNDAKYEPGQGTLVRWTSIFQASGTAGTEAISGYGNEEDGFFFGYDGESFGILHRFAGKSEHQALTITAGAGTATGNITLTLNGRPATVAVTQTDSSQAIARAIDAATFAGWQTQAIGADVIFISHAAEDKPSNFAFTDTDTTGTAASFTETISGVAPTNDWIPQTSWNIDNFDGDGDSANPSGVDLDQSKGNVFQVKFQWLGFGEILFAIVDAANGRFVDVHRIAYANANTSPSIQNPTLPLYIAAKNGGTSADITVQSSSMAVFTEGGAASIEGLSNAAFGTASGDLTTETSILALINKSVFQGTSNRVQLQFELLTFSAVGAGAAKFTTVRAYSNPILGGDPVFTDVSTETSVVAFDTAGTTVTGGDLVAEFSFGAAVENFTIDLTTFTGTSPPGTLIVITGETNAGTSDMDLGLIWRELF